MIIIIIILILMEVDVVVMEVLAEVTELQRHLLADRYW